MEFLELTRLSVRQNEQESGRIADRTKELIEDPAAYAAVTQGPMTTDSFLVAMRWMFDQERWNS